MNKFWNWVKADSGERTLYLEGVIAEESWFDDDVTPAAFKKDLLAGSGPVTLHINSPGGDVIAASQIYTMLMDYPHDVTVRIDGIAASAASVIAMAGSRVYMSPTSLMMIHNPLTFALGDSEEMRKAIQLLEEVKESIINAYEIKTGLSRTRLSHMMDAETWMNAQKALELGFCDDVLYQEAKASPVENSFTFSRRAVTNCLLNKLMPLGVSAVDLSGSSIATSAISTNLITGGEISIGALAQTEQSSQGPEAKPDTQNRVNATDLEKRLARYQYV